MLDAIVKVELKLIPCRCGNKEPSIDQDEKTKATYIECLNCKRVVASPKPNDAQAMWNAAMQPKGS
jgi:hypothetical protein